MSDVRLIDANALKEILNSQMNFDDNCRDSVFDIIDNAPTMVAPNVNLGVISKLIANV